jgi:hypothetical protein
MNYRPSKDANDEVEGNVKDGRSLRSRPSNAQRHPLICTGSLDGNTSCFDPFRFSMWLERGIRVVNPCFLRRKRIKSVNQGADDET